MNRRDFVAGSAGCLLALSAGELDARGVTTRKSTASSKVSLIKSRDRATAIPRAIELLGVNPVHGKKILLKPNLNTADPFPASTHNETLIVLIKKLKRMGATEITIGERCGPPDTREVLKAKGIEKICREHRVDLINFEELPDKDWIKIKPEGSHWLDGFEVARPILTAESIVSTCCLKTHGYGGVFTMSLKLSVGITHKRNMLELHGSMLSMKKMIAEINQVYSPSLILMDGVDIFSDGGPAHGTLKKANVIIAGTDRIAVDAVGLAVLKEIGSNKTIMKTRIFEQGQIARAVELSLGVAAPDKIDIVTDDVESNEYGEKLMAILKKEAG